MDTYSKMNETNERNYKLLLTLCNKMHALLFARITKMMLSSLEGSYQSSAAVASYYGHEITEINIVGISESKLEEKAMFSNYAQDWH